jgi:hypothetical protein
VSLDDTSEDVSPDEHDVAWAAEIAERLRVIDAGEVKAAPWSEVRERILATTAQMSGPRPRRAPHTE